MPDYGLLNLIYELKTDHFFWAMVALEMKCSIPVEIPGQTIYRTGFISWLIGRVIIQVIYRLY